MLGQVRDRSGMCLVCLTLSHTCCPCPQHPTLPKGLVDRVQAAGLINAKCVNCGACLCLETNPQLINSLSAVGDPNYR
jgi:hypothetical protein